VCNAIVITVNFGISHNNVLDTDDLFE